MTYKDLMIARLTFQQMLMDLESFAWAEGIYIVRSYCQRTIDEQAQMVNSGASQTMKSLHLKALAQDYVMLDNLDDYDEVTDSDDPRWKKLGDYWKAFGGDWGGDWGWDSGHFEYNP